MGVEIERKFLVTGDGWREGAGELFKQGYLCADSKRSVRVRRTSKGAKLTIKGVQDSLVSRYEFEYDIPVADADSILASLCIQPIIEKTRYRVTVGAHLWEVDEFHGANAGLVVAEIELTSEDEVFNKPAWVGKEVSDDPRYLNSSLATKPYSSW